jgi:hypothetical protein
VAAFRGGWLRKIGCFNWESDDTVLFEKDDLCNGTGDGAVCVNEDDRCNGTGDDAVLFEKYDR